MTVWLGVAVYSLVHGLGIWLLHASGTWDTLFGPRRPSTTLVIDPLTHAPTGWIENHSFWDLAAAQATADDEFWGDREAL